ncbi:glycosyltransferase [Chitinophaga japonensis]|uniref:Glycosyltransferase involved in cell wall biosynthesis n=1 Tax=Chitinophaga japonensis TaxID=104662 RepID=A0A562T5B3_CHIJA|nr:glycosyltransferase [Chitinophaga japonensis]TWI88731.1 glycosyltransferase involved in cell wall biosynthesis [Chitinophaga japonensis]
MKICFITLGDIKSIATMKRALGMANPLQALGWEVSLIALDSEENRNRIAIECNDAIQVHYYKECALKDEVQIKTDLVNRIGPDFIYFCSFSFRNRILKGRLLHKPKIFIEHSELASGIPDNKGLKKYALLLLEYWSVHYADGLVCASRYLEREYRKRGRQLLRKNLPILYSPYAFNNDVMDAPRIKLDELKERYKHKLVLLYMGTMTRNYGLFTMLEAVEQTAKTRPDIKLLLLGRGRHLEEAKAYVKERRLENWVEFLGYTPENELSSYFERADAFISPLNDTVQDWARCPSKIYMYIPFHKPVFTSNIGEPKEIFGQAGHYFDTTKPATLSALIDALAEGRLQQTDLNIAEHSWDQRCIDFTNWVSARYAVRLAPAGSGVLS